MLQQEKYPIHCSDTMNLPISVIETEVDIWQYTINQKTVHNCFKCDFIFKKKITKSISLKENMM